MKTNTLITLLLLLVSTTGFSQTVLSLENYMDDKLDHQLEYVIKVEADKNVLTLWGYQASDALVERRVKLEKRDVLAISEFNHVFSRWLPPSLTTVPFKVRPKLDKFRTTATSGLTNVGLNFDLFRYKIDRYFDNGNKSNAKWNMGLWLAPTVEELDSVHTEGFLKKDVKSKQLFISSAFTLNYSYNNITFTFVPIGFDFSTSSVGSEWVYNKKRWWGFGIGVEPKVLASILNGGK